MTHHIPSRLWLFGVFSVGSLPIPSFSTEDASPEVREISKEILH